MPVVHYEDHSHAEDLLTALSSRAEPWVSEIRTWIYRGQGDATWSLVPSALRRDGNSWFKFRGLGGNRWLTATPALRLHIEFNVVWQFAAEADRQGLSVPGYGREWIGPEVREKFDTLTDRFLKEGAPYPPPDWAAMFGMAQHYGVPTRLLDWSERAYIALYFAARDAARGLEANRRRKRSRLAVWALNVNLERLESERHGKIQVVRAPWSTNPNLQAQKGLFTVQRERISHATSPTSESEHKPPALRGLEKVATSLINEAGGKAEAATSPPMIWCFRLPWEQASSALDFLRQEGICGASMFPGYSGVATAMRERRFYRDW